MDWQFRSHCGHRLLDFNPLPEECCRPRFFIPARTLPHSARGNRHEKQSVPLADVSSATRTLLAVAASVLLASPAFARLPADAAERAALVGQPASVVVEPASIVLAGPRTMQQVVVTGKYADGTVRDLTPFCEMAFEAPGIADLGELGFLTPLKDGATNLVVKAGSQTAKVPVTVKDFGKPQPVSFRHELIAALNVGGCNRAPATARPAARTASASACAATTRPPTTSSSPATCSAAAPTA